MIAPIPASPPDSPRDDERLFPPVVLIKGQRIVTVEDENRAAGRNCCLGFCLAAIVGAVFSYVMYHAGISYGRQEAAPRCLAALNACILQSKNFSFVTSLLP